MTSAAMNVRSFIHSNSIFVAAALTICLISLSSLFTLLGKYEALSFNETKEQIEETNEKINNMFVYMSEMDKGLRGFMISPDKKFLMPFEKAVSLFPANSDTVRALLEEHHFPNMDSFVKADRALSGYYSLLQSIITFKEQGNTEAALAIYNEDPGYPVWQVWNAFATEALAFEQARYEEAKARYEDLLGVASIMQVLLILIGMPTLIFVIHQMWKSGKRRQQLFVDLSASQRQYLFAHQSEEDHADEQSVINRLIQSLEQAASFIKQIAQGNYAVHWKVSTKKTKPTTNKTWPEPWCKCASR